VASAERTCESSLAGLRQAEAYAANANVDERRYRELVDKEEVSRQMYDRQLTAAPSQEALVASRLASAQANLKLVDQRRAELNQTRQRAEEARANQPRQIAIQRAGAVNRQAGAQVALAQVHQAALHQNSGAGRRDYRREDGRSWRASGRGPGDVRHHADPRHLRNRQFQGDADS
jgi:membrane fusion protein (multidrug efflux system)